MLISLVGVCRSSPPQVMVATLAVVEDLQEQLLTREELLNSREGTIVTWEDELMTSKHALGRACVERDAEHA
jgi:hypothetical protein